MNKDKVLNPKEYSGSLYGDYGYILNGVKSERSYATRQAAQRAFDRARDKYWKEQDEKFKSGQLN